MAKPARSKHSNAPQGEASGNIWVCVRVRPWDGKGASRSLSVNETQPIISLLSEDKTKGHKRQSKFQYNHVFDEGSSNRDVYEQVGVAALTQVLDGYNSTIFAYGQTGSGKTHTMLGSDAQPGVIPLLGQALFKEIQAKQTPKQSREGGGTTRDQAEYRVTVSYLEVYQEQVLDLLEPGKQPLRLREHPSLGVFADGLAEVRVATADDVAQLLLQGSAVRKVASTDMNDRSSRSHAVFMMRVQQRHVSRTRGEGEGGREKESVSTMSARLYLVDLAGSESVRKTKATGQTLKQGASINRSLFELGNVINALSSGTKRHVNYRNSALTMLLRDSLGGNARTAVVATVSAAPVHAPETRTTLMFASRANTIQVKAVRNMDTTTRVISELRAEVTRLKQLLQGAGEGGEGASADQAQEVEAVLAALDLAKRASWDYDTSSDETQRQGALQGTLDVVAGIGLVSYSSPKQVADVVFDTFLKIGMEEEASYIASLAQQVFGHPKQTQFHTEGEGEGERLTDSDMDSLIEYTDSDDESDLDDDDLDDSECDSQWKAEWDDVDEEAPAPLAPSFLSSSTASSVRVVSHSDLYEGSSIDLGDGIPCFPGASQDE
ncbi:kinesin-like protein [Kipferlia bialata]|uniref:Kinesin-like protein n=1 Tax=Kipferlia bialata TaxID=797122 RepID=A0A9K3CN54_9EUKA|nr:kinesin-like protein [Kipferlia bialata]|eukprot:g913.t1